MTDDIDLREVNDDDLEIFFRFQQDPVGRHMAGFTSKDGADRRAFDAHWAKIRADDSTTLLTIVRDGEVAGNIGSWWAEGDAHVTYWIAPEHWGKGIATRALRRFLDLVVVRPMHASTAGDNIASMRVLEKVGFKVVGRGRAFANARGEEIDEVFFRLD